MTREEIMQLNTDYLNGCESEHKMNELFNYVLELQEKYERQSVVVPDMLCITSEEMQKCKDIVKKYTPKQQPCEDAISREAAIKVTCNDCKYDCRYRESKEYCDCCGYAVKDTG